MQKVICYATKFFLLAMIVFTFSSCEQYNEHEDVPGNLEFTFLASDFQDGLKSAASDTADHLRYHLLISVMDEDSNIVLDKEMVPLYKFSNQFISKKVELKQGVYILIEFMVVNPVGEVIFATPKKGAPLAYLVKTPLPIDFKIRAGAATGLRIEVLPVGNHPPEDFGYISFGVHVVKPLRLYTAVYINNPIIIAPSKFVSAKLAIYDPDGWKYEFRLEPKVNEIVIRRHYGKYVFVVTKDSLKKKFIFRLEELRMSSPEKPLLLPIGDNAGVLEMIIKTNPDATADALITNLDADKNFGDHKLFAASFKTEPVLTVMRTTRSLMYMDIRRHLPKSATIKRVELTLEVIGNIYPMNSNSDSSNVVPLYRGVLRQITEPWKESGVTWKNQPETINANQVFIDYHPWIDCNKRTYDVTSLFVPVDKTDAPNHGFMFIHHPENLPGGIEFGSSDAGRPEVRPLFKAYYTLPD